MSMLVVEWVPVVALAQNKPAPPLQYVVISHFLSFDSKDQHRPKIKISIPYNYFMDGIVPAEGSTDNEFLLRMSWPSWVGDPQEMDPDALMILGGLSDDRDTETSLARNLRAIALAPGQRNENLDRSINAVLEAPQQSNLPVPLGHGIKQLTHGSPTFLDDLDVYVLMSSEPEVILMCDKDGVVPQCQERFNIGHLDLQVSYPRKRVGSWYEIMNDVKKKFSDFIKK